MAKFPDELDVRVFIPTKRHETLLGMFKELPKGESFVFINDHDPKPLYYEFCSIFGDVVGWEYLSRDPRAWKVKVTRTEESKGRDMDGASTLMDLRKTDDKDWKHVIFHRYGLMPKNNTMKLIAGKEPVEVKKLFEKEFEDKFSWQVQKNEDGEYIAHITKLRGSKLNIDSALVTEDFDVRPHPPAKRHDLVFDAFDRLKPGEAFIFTNDHDPKPLYYQIEAESKVDFAWQYLESGPQVWRVKVARR